MNEESFYKYEPLMDKFRRKSLEIAKKSLKTQNNIRKLVSKPKKKDVGFGLRQISWA